MKRLLPLLLSTIALAGFPAVAQNAAPEIPYYHSVGNPHELLLGGGTSGER